MLHSCTVPSIPFQFITYHVTARSVYPSNIRSLSLTERSDISIRILRQNFCESFLRGGVRANFLSSDTNAAAAAETRACHDTVFPALCRGAPPADPCNAAPLGT